MSKASLARACTSAAIFAGTVLLAGCHGAAWHEARAGNEAETEFIALHDAYLAEFRPLYVESERASWEASVTGTDASFARHRAAQEALVDLHSDRAVFTKLERVKDGRSVVDPVLKRQLGVMYRAHLPHQSDTALLKEIVALETEAEQVFNTHRSLVSGKRLTENEVRRVLAGSTDSALAEAAWKGYMEVGAKVEGHLRKLVALRNQVARQLGFANYYSMQLTLQEIDEDELFRLFDELDTLTRGPFAALKARIDAERAARFGIAPAALQPWHFGDLFFQEALGSGAAVLNELYAEQDPVELARIYYASMGMDVEDILARSDLFEKPGKDPHAFCADIDRAGDVRILCNIKPNLYQTGTVLHELGHAVYDKYIAEDVPFVLRTPAHAMTTEGVAILLGTMVSNEDWLGHALQLSPQQLATVAAAGREASVAEKLIFSRWAQVMVRFERGMYSNPDQDLGRLWWNLKRRYQLLNPPDDPSRPDYGAKT
ncbi:MAG: M2 family metallopeptidase, partial [Planctomycetes bacterium]|nr:M2 family metallopeptidase [Planctomycetota bacterium]